MSDTDLDFVRGGADSEPKGVISWPQMGLIPLSRYLVRNSVKLILIDFISTSIFDELLGRNILIFEFIADIYCTVYCDTA